MTQGDTTLNGRWVVTHAGDVDTGIGQQLTLDFNGTQFYGTAPCHSIAAPLMLGGDEIAFMQLDLSGENCNDDAVNKAEQAYLYMLPRISRYAIDATGVLTLYIGDAPAIRAQRAP